MNILALDPARRTGYAHTSGDRGVIDIGTTNAVAHLFNFVMKFHALHPFTILAVEHAMRSANNFNTAEVHAEYSGVLKLAASQLDCQFVQVHAMSLKAWAAHSGRAKKGDMRKWCRVHYSLDIADDNECDAFLLLKYVEAGQHLKVAAMSKKAVRKRESSRRKTEKRLF